jgi:polysaccharide biosynthesis protein PslG
MSWGQPIRLMNHFSPTRANASWPGSAPWRVPFPMPMKSKSKMLLTLLIATVCLTTQAAGLPPLVIPAGVGVNIHFTRGHERDLDMIAAGGFKFVRMDFGWAGIERVKGQYDWSAYEELTANLEKQGLRPIYILDYSNPLYEESVTSKNPLNSEEQRDTASPQHPESVAAFAQWAAAAAKHFQGRSIVWEIWNEPNISFWKPKPDVQQYSTLALATCKAVRETVPDATIVGPATSGLPTEFLEKFFQSGVLEDLDAVSVHPYRNYSKPPETALEDYARLRGLIERYAPPNKKKLPILSGEWGYATHTKGVSFGTQAAFIARQQLANLLDGIPISIWYDWKDDGTDPNEREHNFGAVTHDLKPKPAYVAVQTLTKELAGYKVDRRLPTESDKDYILLCTNAQGNQKLAAWTLSPSNSVSLYVTESAKPEKVVLSDGPSYTAKLREQLVLALGPAPVYVTLSPARLVDSGPSPAPTPALNPANPQN